MAKWLGFVDENNRPRPRRGEGSVEDVVSHKPQVKAALRAQAAGIARRASMRLDVMPKERTGESQVRLDKGDLDYYVMLTDRTAASAGGIEKQLGILRESIRRG